MPRGLLVLLLLSGLPILVVDRLRITPSELPPRPVVDRSRTVDFDFATASLAELRFLPGVGPGLARTLHHGIHVQGLDDLDRIESLPGIGPRRAEAIRAAFRRDDR